MVKGKSIYTGGISNIDIVKNLEIYLYFFSSAYIKVTIIRDTCIKNTYIKDNCIRNTCIRNVFIKNADNKNAYNIGVVQNLKIHL